MTEDPAPNKLRAWRLSTKPRLTQREVAALVGLSTWTVNRLESGNARLAPMQKVHFARCLGVPLDELFEAEEMPGPVEAAG